MKHVIYLLATFLTATLFTSCEKVIDVNVNNAAKKYVIEGVLTDQQEGCQVKITQTKSINEDNNFPGISGAQVRITDEAGVVTNLTESYAGVYKSNLRGVPGTKYTLLVSIGNEIFTASSRMPQVVTLDSIYITEMNMMGEKELLANVIFKDPEGKGNAYRFVQYRNSKKVKDIYGQNDDLSDGRLNTFTFFSHDNEIKKGDHLTVEMQCIDAAIYKYWYSLWQGATGEGNAASPANPVSNLSGGALGYFSAHTVSSKSIVVE